MESPTLSPTMAACLAWCRTQEGPFLPHYGNGNTFNKATFRALRDRGLLVTAGIVAHTVEMRGRFGRGPGRTYKTTTAIYRNPE